MFKILYQKIDLKNDLESIYNKVLPTDVVKHIEMIHNQERKNASIHAWLLLNKLCNEVYHHNLADFTFTYNENGKPIFDSFFVSLAHSGDYSCVGIASFPIGIDMEVIRTLYADKRIKKVLCDDERLSNEEFLIRFSQEETLVKKKGSFLGIPRKKLCALHDEVSSIILELDNQNYILSYTPNDKTVEISKEEEK